MTESARRSAGRRKIILLALLFALPVVVAYVLYYSGWRPVSTGNYGELVQPPRPVAEARFTLLDGRTIRFSELRGKWVLMTFGTAECADPCERNLIKIRQVIAAQGKNAERVQSVFVATDARARDWLGQGLKDYPHMHAIVGPPAAVTVLAGQFTPPTEAPPDNRIYVVDPLGNFIMKYPADADPNRMRKDLARLLRASRIG